MLDFRLYPTDINAYRLPHYARFDLSLTYQKRYSSWTLSPYLQIFNLGNRKNIWFVNYDTNIGAEAITQEVETVSMLPMLPTIGVAFEF